MSYTTESVSGAIKAVHDFHDEAWRATGYSTTYFNSSVDPVAARAQLAETSFVDMLATDGEPFMPDPARYSSYDLPDSTAAVSKPLTGVSYSTWGDGKFGEDWRGRVSVTFWHGEQVGEVVTAAVDQSPWRQDKPMTVSSKVAIRDLEEDGGVVNYERGVERPAASGEEVLRFLDFVRALGDTSLNAD